MDMNELLQKQQQLRQERDPEKQGQLAKELAAYISKSHEARVDRMLRVNNMVMRILGSLLLVGGLMALILSFDGSLGPMSKSPLLIVGATMAPIGLLFSWFAGRYSPQSTRILQSGKPAKAKVISIDMNGRSFSMKSGGTSVSAVIPTILFEVQRPQMKPYQVKYSYYLPSSVSQRLWKGELQAGTVLDAKVSRKNSNKIAIVWDAEWRQE
jgi:hypothetical protein